MSLSIVNHGKFTSSGSLTCACALGWTPTVGNELIVFGGAKKATALGVANPSASDNYGNTYVRDIQGYDPTNFYIDASAVRTKVTSTGAGFTITFATAGNTPDENEVYVVEVSGEDGTTPVPDKVGQGAETGTSATPGSATNTNANELWFVFYITNDSGNPGTLTMPGAPWTTLDSNTNGAGGVVSGVAYQLVSSVAAQNPAATVANGPWAAVMIGVQQGLQTIAPNNANIFYSPYNWRLNGSTWAQANSSGAYLKLNFTSSMLNLLVDVSTLAGQAASTYPVIVYRIDQGDWTQTTLTAGQTSVAIGSGLAAGAHTAKICFVGYFGSANINRWNSTASPYQALRITGFQIDVNGSVSAATKRSKNLLLYSHSIGEGYNADTTPTAGSTPTNNFNTLFAYLPRVAEALDAEYGMVAYGGSKLTATSTVGNNIPGLNPSAGIGYWNYLDDVTSRLSGGLFSPAPDEIIIHHGWNDASAGVSGATYLAQLNDLLSKLATAAPSAKVFNVQDIGNQRQYATQNAGATYGANQYYIDLDSGYTDAFSAPFGTGISSSWRTPDGVHPNSEAHHELATRLVKAIQAKLGGSSGTTRHYLTNAAPGIS